jgi:hypothetical protein
LRILLLFPLGFNGQLSDKCNVTNPHLTHNWGKVLGQD